MSSTSTVHSAIVELAHWSLSSQPPALMGFEASRHLRRSDFGGTAPYVLDMPIAEETILGTAIGLALSGRDVLVDLMFEGFLSRCVEPLLVGWPTALALADGEVGRIVVRVLGSPVTSGGPSHSTEVVRLLEDAEHITPVCVTCTGDVKWAVRTAPSGSILILTDLPVADVARGELISDGGGTSPPMRLWQRGSSRLALCSNADLIALTRRIDAGELDFDVLSCPATALRHDSLHAVVDRYRYIEQFGVRVVED